ncbi:hypothetical protein [Cohnella fermenti]|uniref:Uncharacterized protein n=1 Tax=Cohnella fermenti TaxID=2565925 RepID=A0A4S4BV20_9BACL|nr:hypothetical protein [Cohnella fermenti]THF78445.1 hypothetical protein E6C55_14660 [Cohnella fermenti]
MEPMMLMGEREFMRNFTLASPDKGLFGCFYAKNHIHGGASGLKFGIYAKNRIKCLGLREFEPMNVKIHIKSHKPSEQGTSASGRGSEWMSKPGRRAS